MPSRRGFTFTEVMFAVVILGIGFIMIAAVFPVAIRMNGQSAEGTQASLVSQLAVQSIGTAATDAMFPQTYKYDSAASPSSAGARLAAYWSNLYPPFVAVGEGVFDDTASGGCGPQTDKDAAVLSTDPRDLAAATWAGMRGTLLPATDRRMGCAVAYARAGPGVVAAGGSGASSPVVKLIVVTAQARGERAGFNDLDNLIQGPGGLMVPADGIPFQRDTKIPYGPISSYSTSSETANEVGAGAVYATGQPSGTGTQTGSTPATLQFKRQVATFYYGANLGEADQIKIQKLASTSGGTGDISAAVEGTYVIIARPNVSNTSGGEVGSNTAFATNAKFSGHVFRLGKEVTHDSLSVTFELVQGQDVAAMGLTSALVTTTSPRLADLNALCEGPVAQTTTVSNKNVYEVLFLGRGLANPAYAYGATLPDTTRNAYVGGAMDVSVYSTTIGLSK